MTKKQRADSAAGRESLLAAVVESSGDAIVACDRAGTVIAWNAAAAELYGYTEAEALAQSITMIIPSPRQAEISDQLATAFAGELVEPHDTDRLRRDGEIVSVSITISPVFGS